MGAARAVSRTPPPPLPLFPAYTPPDDVAGICNTGRTAISAESSIFTIARSTDTYRQHSSGLVLPSVRGHVYALLAEVVDDRSSPPVSPPLTYRLSTGSHAYPSRLRDRSRLGGQDEMSRSLNLASTHRHEIHRKNSYVGLRASTSLTSTVSRTVARDCSPADRRRVVSRPVFTFGGRERTSRRTLRMETHADRRVSTCRFLSTSRGTP